MEQIGKVLSADFLNIAESSGRLPAELVNRLKLDAQGLLCAVVQDWKSKRVLMVAWMNLEALRRTLVTGQVTYWSRSRQSYWLKGETSGHYQFLRQIEIDCDADALLLQVEQVAGACHTGLDSCFDAGGELPAILNSGIN